MTPASQSSTWPRSTINVWPFTDGVCEEEHIVSERVMEQLMQSVPRRPSLRAARLAAVALALVAAGVLLASNGNLRQTVRRLGAIVIS